MYITSNNNANTGKIYQKAIIWVVIVCFLFNTVFIDLAWALESESLVRVRPIESRASIQEIEGLFKTEAKKHETRSHYAQAVAAPTGGDSAIVAMPHVILPAISRTSPMSMAETAKALTRVSLQWGRPKAKWLCEYIDDAVEDLAINDKGASGVIFYEGENHYYILSASHVTNPLGLSRQNFNPQVWVTLSNGMRVQAEVVAENRTWVPDISVMRIKKEGIPKEAINIIPLGNEDLVKEALLKKVLILGYPQSKQSWERTRGKITQREYISSEEDKITINAKTESGYSGGPVIYKDKVIAIVGGLSEKSITSAISIVTIFEMLQEIINGTITTIDNLPDESDKLALTEALSQATRTSPMTAQYKYPPITGEKDAHRSIKVLGILRALKKVPLLNGDKYIPRLWEKTNLLSNDPDEITEQLGDKMAVTQYRKAQKVVSAALKRVDVLGEAVIEVIQNELAIIGVFSKTDLLFHSGIFSRSYRRGIAISSRGRPVYFISIPFLARLDPKNKYHTKLAALILEHGYKWNSFYNKLVAEGKGTERFRKKVIEFDLKSDLARKRVLGWYWYWFRAWHFILYIKDLLKIEEIKRSLTNRFIRFKKDLKLLFDEIELNASTVISAMRHDAEAEGKGEDAATSYRIRISKMQEEATELVALNMAYGDSAQARNIAGYMSNNLSQFGRVDVAVRVVDQVFSYLHFLLMRGFYEEFVNALDNLRNGKFPPNLRGKTSQIEKEEKVIFLARFRLLDVKGFVSNTLGFHMERMRHPENRAIVTSVREDALSLIDQIETNYSGRTSPVEERRINIMPGKEEIYHPFFPDKKLFMIEKAPEDRTIGKPTLRFTQERFREQIILIDEAGIVFIVPTIESLAANAPPEEKVHREYFRMDIRNMNSPRWFVFYSDEAQYNLDEEVYPASKIWPEEIIELRTIKGIAIEAVQHMLVTRKNEMLGRKWSHYWAVSPDKPTGIKSADSYHLDEEGKLTGLVEYGGHRRYELATKFAGLLSTLTPDWGLGERFRIADNFVLAINMRRKDRYDTRYLVKLFLRNVNDLWQALGCEASFKRITVEDHFANRVVSFEIVKKDGFLVIDGGRRGAFKKIPEFDSIKTLHELFFGQETSSRDRTSPTSTEPVIWKFDEESFALDPASQTLKVEAGQPVRIRVVPHGARQKGVIHTGITIGGPGYPWQKIHDIPLVAQTDSGYLEADLPLGENVFTLHWLEDGNAGWWENRDYHIKIYDTTFLEAEELIRSLRETKLNVPPQILTGLICMLRMFVAYQEILSPDGRDTWQSVHRILTQFKDSKIEQPLLTEAEGLIALMPDPYHIDIKKDGKRNWSGWFDLDDVNVPRYLGRGCRRPCRQCSRNNMVPLASNVSLPVAIQVNHPQAGYRNEATEWTDPFFRAYFDGVLGFKLKTDASSGATDGIINLVVIRGWPKEDICAQRSGERSSKLPFSEDQKFSLSFHLGWHYPNIIEAIQAYQRDEDGYEAYIEEYAQRYANIIKTLSPNLKRITVFLTLEYQNCPIFNDLTLRALRRTLEIVGVESESLSFIPDMKVRDGAVPITNGADINLKIVTRNIVHVGKGSHFLTLVKKANDGEPIEELPDRSYRYKDDLLMSALLSGSDGNVDDHLLPPENFPEIRISGDGEVTVYSFNRPGVILMESTLDELDPIEDRTSPMEDTKSGDNIEQLISALEEVTRPRDWSERRRIVEAIGNTGDEKAVPVLIELLSKDKNVRVRRIAAVGLGKIKGDEARKKLIEVVRNQDERYMVRKAAIEALAEINDDEARRFLLKIINAHKEANPEYRVSLGSYHFYLSTVAEKAMRAIRKADRKTSNVSDDKGGDRTSVLKNDEKYSIHISGKIDGYDDPLYAKDPCGHWYYRLEVVDNKNGKEIYATRLDAYEKGLDGYGVLTYKYNAQIISNRHLLIERAIWALDSQSPTYELSIVDLEKDYDQFGPNVHLLAKDNIYSYEIYDQRYIVTLNWRGLDMYDIARDLPQLVGRVNGVKEFSIENEVLTVVFDDIEREETPLIPADLAVLDIFHAARKEFPRTKKIDIDSIDFKGQTFVSTAVINITTGLVLARRVGSAVFVLNLLVEQLGLDYRDMSFDDVIVIPTETTRAVGYPYITTDGALIGIQILRDLVRGRKFVDVGADTGTLGLFGGRLNDGAEVIFSEADTLMHARIKRNAELNGIDDFRVCGNFATDVTGDEVQDAVIAINIAEDFGLKLLSEIINKGEPAALIISGGQLGPHEEVIRMLEENWDCYTIDLKSKWFPGKNYATIIATNKKLAHTLPLKESQQDRTSPVGSKDVTGVVFRKEHWIREPFGTCTVLCHPDAREVIKVPFQGHPFIMESYRNAATELKPDVAAIRFGSVTINVDVKIIPPEYLGSLKNGQFPNSKAFQLRNIIFQEQLFPLDKALDECIVDDPDKAAELSCKKIDREHAIMQKDWYFADGWMRQFGLNSEDEVLLMDCDLIINSTKKGVIEKVKDVIYDLEKAYSLEGLLNKRGWVLYSFYRALLMGNHTKVATMYAAHLREKDIPFDDELGRKLSDFSMDDIVKVLDEHTEKILALLNVYGYLNNVPKEQLQLFRTDPDAFVQFINSSENIANLVFNFAIRHTYDNEFQKIAKAEMDLYFKPAEDRASPVNNDNVVIGETDNRLKTTHDKELLKNWLVEWAEVNGVTKPLKIILENGEIQIQFLYSPESNLFYTLAELEYKVSHNKLIINEQDVYSIGGNDMKQKRLMTLLQLFLIYVYSVDEVEYPGLIGHGDDLVKGILKMGIFSHVEFETEDNEDVIAVVNKPVVELLASVPEAFMRFLTKQDIVPRSSPVEIILPAPIPPNEMIGETHERLQLHLLILNKV